MRTVCRGGAWGLVALALSGCPGTIDDPAPFIAVHRADAGMIQCPDVVADILSNPQSCAASNCHAASAFQVGLDLESPNLVERLRSRVGTTTCGLAPLLTPGAPERSLLYSKLLPEPECGSQMPLRMELTDLQVQCVRLWILGLSEPPSDAGVLPRPDAG